MPRVARYSPAAAVEEHHRRALIGGLPVRRIDDRELQLAITRLFVDVRDGFGSGEQRQEGEENEKSYHGSAVNEPRCQLLPLE
jgi:hypothetical protein